MAGLVRVTTKKNHINAATMDFGGEVINWGNLYSKEITSNLGENASNGIVTGGYVFIYSRP